MFEAQSRLHLVPFDGSFRIAEVATAPPAGALPASGRKDRLRDLVEQLDDLQRVLYADDRHAVLLVFQAMDAAGKDGTIRAVLSGVNPTGCRVHSFKQPSTLELDHDFLWRTTQRLPGRGTIGVFNRSYYEEVLVVRVHPELLVHQRLPAPPPEPEIWQQRLESIRSHELHLARNGTVILKFWLNVSKEEQRRRFLSRLDEPEKNWKFSTGDVRERAFFDAYMAAYEEALNATSTPWAPWHAIPADDKPYMRVAVAEILRDTLAGLGLGYPVVSEERRETFEQMRPLLEDPEPADRDRR